ncbi:endolytic transglycosylase MltG [uncultured Aureimonas sp.]|uniref:endolytic transglycosylase MltG n=1 Tax=uncultured Aureimonas sp. TaxID=1604662 RepID=UPI0025F698C1|nr:endolytic transglycosylase MltG [uncultured Aureimonas sp.]
MTHGFDEQLPPAGEEPTRRTKPKRRSRHARNGFVILMNFGFSLALLAAIAGGLVFYWGKQTFDSTGPLKTEATYLVNRGAGLESIAAGLERAGIVSDAQVFEYGVRVASMEGLSGRGDTGIRAGEYAFAPGSSMRDVMDTLRSGNSIQHAVTIPEGWTIQQIYARLESDPVLVGDMPPMVAEGTLLPETYTFTRGMTRAAMVDRMKEAQSELVEEIWKGRQDDLPVKDIGEFVTLASIVEKETGIASERPHVASVFINRLREGMRLQSDPTIIYGVWGGAGKPSDEPIRQSHIASNSPYNTYVIRGLPPGPIANPGRASLEAVAHPLDTKDLYFVADGTGGHAFARTLNEHNANVRRYRDIERAAAAGRADAASPDDPAVAQ